MRLLIRIVEERKQLIVFALANCFILVGVAARTTHRQPKPYRPRRLCAIKTGLDTKLLLIGTTFRIGQGLTMKGRGQALHVAGIGQQITGQLRDGKLIKGHIRVDGIDDPVAITIGIGAWIVLLVSIGIGVAGHVEPMPAPTFAEMRRVQQAIHQVFVGVWVAVADKRFNFLLSDGSSPRRSKLKRRISVVRSASGAGVSPNPFNLATMNWSISLRIAFGE
jgi:hypothetical protein